MLLSWCRGFSAHTSLRDFWNKLRRIYHPRPFPLPFHPNPRAEAERLEAHFATRISPDLLSNVIRKMQRELLAAREQQIREACMQGADSDQPFALQELEAAFRTKTDTAPGADRVTYSIVRHLGLTRRTPYFPYINSAWRKEGSLILGKLPSYSQFRNLRTQLTCA